MSPTPLHHRRRLAAGALAAMLCTSIAAAQEVAAPELAPAVTVATATVRELLQQVPVTGTLVPREEVLVYPETNGYRIATLNAEVGDVVEPGDVLAELDARTLRARVAESEAALASAEAAVQQAEAQVASAEATLFRTTRARERTQTLRERGTVAEAALEEAEEVVRTAEATLQSAQSGVVGAEAQRQQAAATLDVARLELENATITAPVGGIVSGRTGQLGAIASAAGDPIYRIIQDGEIEVEADVIETDLGLLDPGDPATVEVAGVGTATGRVRLLSPEVDRASRLGTVWIALEPRDGLRSGVYAGGWITAVRRQGLAVPASAVIADANGRSVLVVEDGILHRRPVTAGLIWQEWREIVDGLAEGEEVVARAAAFFGEGDRITPVRAEEPVALDGATGGEVSQ